MFYENLKYLQLWYLSYNKIHFVKNKCYENIPIFRVFYVFLDNKVKRLRGKENCSFLATKYQLVPVFYQNPSLKFYFLSFKRCCNQMHKKRIISKQIQYSESKINIEIWRGILEWKMYESIMSTVVFCFVELINLKKKNNQ